MRNTLLALLFLTPLLSGCVAVVAATAVGGALVAQEVTDDGTYIARLDNAVGDTWAATKTTLSYASLKPIDVDPELRRIVAEVDGATVTCTVETYDLNRSILKVSATKYGFSSGATSKDVFDRILSNLDRP